MLAFDLQTLNNLGNCREDLGAMLLVKLKQMIREPTKRNVKQLITVLPAMLFPRCLK